MSKKLIVIVISLTLVALLAACSPGMALSATGPMLNTNPQQTTPGSPRSITVTGSGKSSLSPDIAYINIGVHTESEDVAQALADNNEQVEQVITALRSAGVDANDIQTSSFNIYPSQQYGPTGEVTSTKYMVDNTVYVTVRDLANLGTLLDTAVSAGANSINGIQFDAADKSAALTAARAQAVENARAQAEELAEAAGVELGEILSISYNTQSGFYPVYDRAMGGGAGAAESAVPIASGQMQVTADVTVVFAIQ